MFGYTRINFHIGFEIKYMPLAATHIKFALDTKDRFEIEDLTKYLSGTIYPDSRYLSGLKRDQTHGEFLLKDDFAIDDFRKGWKVHYICDKLFDQISDKIFPEFFADRSNTREGSDWWIAKTALKGIVDLQLLNIFDIKPFLPLLDHVESPYNESSESVKRFSRLVQGLYGSDESLTLKDNERMLIKMGVASDLATKVTLRAEQLMDSGLDSKISSLYEEMLEQK